MAIHYNLSSEVYASSWLIARQHFLGEQAAGFLEFEESYSIESRGIDIINAILDLLRLRGYQPTFRMIGESAVAFRFGAAADPHGLIHISTDLLDNPFRPGRKKIDITIATRLDILAEWAGLIEGCFNLQRMAQVDWFYLDDGHSSHHSIILEPPKPIHPSFYPWIVDGPDAYLDRYMAASASVLLLLGQPGTGKTSLIRHLLFQRSLHAMVSCEDALLKSDGLFLRFLTGDYDVFIVEDADLLLASRQGAGNEAMARFLAVSDGLVSLGSKKMIFSTNLESVRDIDPALLRAGRCHDVLRFRGLDWAEAQVAAAHAGLQIPQRESYTLGELFAGPNPTPAHRPLGIS